MRWRGICVLCLLVLPFLAPSAHADSILGSNLTTFAILGGAGVSIAGTGSVITGSVGACCVATAITGVIPTNFNISGGTVQSGGGTASAAQGELAAAMTALGGMTPTGTVSSLGGLTLGPGVYSSATTMDLTGTLNLNGGGNANALWVFLVGSALTTASNSVVNVTNTGSGAGVYWVLPSTGGSATLGSGSTFQGNILAQISITADTTVNIPCGRLLTQTASVTLAGTDTIGNVCSGILAGSNGLSAGGTITGGVVTTLPPATVPEPSTFLFLATGLIGGVVRMRQVMARR